MENTKPVDGSVMAQVLANKEPQGGQPEGGQPEGGQPEGGQPQGGQPEGGQPEGGQPEGGQPEGGQPEGGQPEGGQPEGGQPEGGQPEGGQPEGGQPEDKHLAEFRSQMEAQIFQETEGRASNLDELISHTKSLAEKANEKPSLNMDLLKKLDEQVKQEKGFGLAEALQWNNLDASKLNDVQKFRLGVIADNPDKPDSFYNMEFERFDPILKWDKQQVEKAIDNEEITENDLRRLQVEYDTIMHNIDQKVDNFKSKYSVNLNFDSENDKPSGPTPEQLSEVKTGLSKALKGLREVKRTVKLPNDLGELEVSVPVSDVEKRELMEVDESLESYTPYRKEDGSIDFERYVQDAHRDKYFDQILQKSSMQAAAEALKRFMANKDNVDRSRQQRQLPDGGMPDNLKALAEQMEKRKGVA